MELLDNWSVGTGIVCCRAMMQKIVELLDNRYFVLQSNDAEDSGATR